MAWTLTNRAAPGTYEGTYSAGANVGDTFTPNQNDIIVVWNVANDATPHTTVTGWGATWTQILAPSGALNFSVWACRIGASPGSSRAFIDFGGGSTNYSAGVIQIAGAHTTAALGVGGSNLFRQAPTPVTTYDPASPMSATTLSAFASSTNLSLTLAGISTNLPLVPKSGFTELFEGSGTTYNPNVYASYKTSSDTVHQVSENTPGDFDFKNVVIVGMEILEDAGGGGSNTTRTLDDTLTVFDEPIRGASFGRTLDDLLAVFDDSYPFKIFEVIIDESYDIIDQLISYRKYVRQLDDSNAVVDELLRGAIFGRLQSDNLVTFDDAIRGTLHGVTATDSLVTIDDLLAYRKFYRRLDDTTDVIDQLTASSSGITVYVVTIDDSIVIYDDLLRCVAYSRGLDEPLTIVDSLNKSVAYCRQSSDALDCFDELYASRWFRRLIDEEVSVVDSLIASITTPAPTSVVPLPVRIGLVRDFIKIGVIR